MPPEATTSATLAHSTISFREIVDAPRSCPRTKGYEPTLSRLAGLCAMRHGVARRGRLRRAAQPLPQARVSASRMPNLAVLAPKLNVKALTCRAIVECPKGGRAKYAFDPKARVFALKRWLPEGMSFPLDFGFVPG